ncbi:uncharacterized protein AMSG_10490 [Thecamonas trahens ATCC 50062]|uniref:Uncharacterized protein n=1 Tax=Thecamonas trahens ATCC 50062 TaxID=461836 RepID=A0A0L0DQB2_THETB|nr:hypothetical protein AMSG_10490 [Thecamonas trahens ATCC 50062]KNC54492.1 hypothetical protein AMSG_10490 [Thecamonas trahens ATCC 50062]|eukprot:XP_013753645.1 hypothetical protein AMSG_10490 [Thecamonas trahens ATCC 50062]
MTDLSAIQPLVNFIETNMVIAAGTLTIMLDTASAATAPIGRRYRQLDFDDNVSHSSSMLASLSNPLSTPVDRLRQPSSPMAQKRLRSGEARPAQQAPAASHSSFKINDTVQPVPYAPTQTTTENGSIVSIMGMREIADAGFHHVNQLRMAYYARFKCARASVGMWALLEKVVQTPLYAASVPPGEVIGAVGAITSGVSVFTAEEATVRHELATAADILRKLPIEVRFIVYEFLSENGSMGSLPSLRDVDICLRNWSTLYASSHDASRALLLAIRVVAVAAIEQLNVASQPRHKLAWLAFVQRLIVAQVAQIHAATHGRLPVLDRTARRTLISTVVEMLPLSPPCRPSPSSDDAAIIESTYVSAPILRGIQSALRGEIMVQEGWTLDGSRLSYLPPLLSPVAPDDADAVASITSLEPLTTVCQLIGTPTTELAISLEKIDSALCVSAAAVISAISDSCGSVVSSTLVGGKVASVTMASVDEAVAVANALHGLTLAFTILRVEYV